MVFELNLYSPNQRIECVLSPRRYEWDNPIGNNEVPFLFVPIYRTFPKVSRKLISYPSFINIWKSFEIVNIEIFFHKKLCIWEKCIYRSLFFFNFFRMLTNGLRGAGVDLLIFCLQSGLQCELGAKSSIEVPSC